MIFLYIYFQRLGPKKRPKLKILEDKSIIGQETSTDVPVTVSNQSNATFRDDKCQCTRYETKYQSNGRRYHFEKEKYGIELFRI